jgi:tetratricopeptide (TPR) repeat protein
MSNPNGPETNGAAEIQLGQGEPAPAPDREPDRKGAFSAFQRGQLAMDRGSFDEASDCFQEAVEKDWTERVYAEWLVEANNRLGEGKRASGEGTLDPDTAPPPALAMPTTTLSPGPLPMPQPTVAPAPEVVDDPHTHPTAPPRPVPWSAPAKAKPKPPPEPTPEERARLAREAQRKKTAERYYKRGLAARRSEQWSEAVACFEGACRAMPMDDLYQQALADANQKLRASQPNVGPTYEPETTARGGKALKRAPTAEEPPKRAPSDDDGFSLWDAIKVQMAADPRLAAFGALVLVFGGVYFGWKMGDEPEPENTASLELVQELGIFTDVEKVDRGYRASIEEGLLDMTEEARVKRCRELASALPNGGPLYLTSTHDEHSMMCRGE